MVRADGLFVRLNLLLLLVVAFLPFPTRLVADFFGNNEPERIAVVFYGVVLLTIAALMSALWRYARGSTELLRADWSDDELAALTSKSNPGLVLLLLSTVSAFLVIPFREIVTALRRLRGRRS